MFVCKGFQCHINSKIVNFQLYHTSFEQFKFHNMDNHKRKVFSSSSFSFIFELYLWCFVNIFFCYLDSPFPISVELTKSLPLVCVSALKRLKLCFQFSLTSCCVVFIYDLRLLTYYLHVYLNLPWTVVIY